MTSPADAHFMMPLDDAAHSETGDSFDSGFEAGSPPLKWSLDSLGDPLSPLPPAQVMPCGKEPQLKSLFRRMDRFSRESEASMAVIMYGTRSAPNTFNFNGPAAAVQFAERQVPEGDASFALKASNEALLDQVARLEALLKAETSKVAELQEVAMSTKATHDAVLAIQIQTHAEALAAQAQAHEAALSQQALAHQEALAAQAAAHEAAQDKLTASLKATSVAKDKESPKTPVQAESGLPSPTASGGSASPSLSLAAPRTPSAQDGAVSPTIITESGYFHGLETMRATRILKLERQLEEARAEKTVHAETVTELQTLVNELQLDFERRVLAKSDENQTLVKELALLKDQFRALNLSNDDARSRASAAEKLSTKHVADSQKWRTFLMNLRAAVPKLDGVATVELDLPKRIASLIAKAANWEGRVSAMMTEFAEMTADLSQSKQRTRTLETDLKAIRAENMELILKNVHLTCEAAEQDAIIRTPRSAPGLMQSRPNAPSPRP